MRSTGLIKLEKNEVNFYIKRLCDSKYFCGFNDLGIETWGDCNGSKPYAEFSEARAQVFLLERFSGSYFVEEL